MTDEILTLVKSLSACSDDPSFQLQILQLRLSNNAMYHKNTNSEQQKLHYEDVLQDVADAISYIMMNKTLNGFSH